MESVKNLFRLIQLICWISGHQFRKILMDWNVVFILILCNFIYFILKHQSYWSINFFLRLISSILEYEDFLFYGFISNNPAISSPHFCFSCLPSSILKYGKVSNLVAKKCHFFRVFFFIFWARKFSLEISYS